MKIKLHLDSQSYSEKPQGGAIGSINNRITERVVELTPAELSSELATGKTVLTGIMNGKRTIKNFVSTQVLMLDFDNKGDLLYKTFDEVKEDEYIKANASFMYKTLSHTEELHKFRVVFILDKPLTTVEEVYGAYDFLLKKFPEADQSCKDPSRIFFGGIESHEVDYMNVLATEGLPKAEAPKVKAPAPVVTKNVEEKRTAKPVATGDIPTWKLIRDGNTEEVRERLGVYAVKLASKVQVANYLVTLDMRDILGIYYNPCYDIFHQEGTPSGSIFKMEDNRGTWLYKCHSSSHDFIGDVIKVVAKLQGVGYTKALNYLMDVCSIEIEVTEQIQELRDQCDLFTNLLLSESLQTTYRAIYNRFRFYKSDIVAILNIFKENIYEDENGNLRSLTWISVRSLSKQLYDGSDSKKDKVSRILNLMCFTEWIDKLDDSQVPPLLLQKLKSNQALAGREKRSNVWELLLLGDDFFETLNSKCEDMAEKGFTMKGFSREYVLRTEGQETADKVYVQDKARGRSKATDKFSEAMQKLIMENVERYGYVVEKDVLAKMQKKYRSKGFSEYKFKQCISEVLDMYALERKRLNKQLREKYSVNLPPKAMPVVLVRAS
ncbi:hypothetical protein OCD65_28015 [Bacillus paranthracis]|uniref:hypothetical protein n=1 Tax=Bacillus cereus group TaxID=86661 RepID=UPI001F5737A8|nr:MULTISPECIES: hypothetical protein [Bacillus cereus group]MCU5020528.1 hypothetical protein [Bacillus paranthracis]